MRYKGCICKAPLDGKAPTFVDYETNDSAVADFAKSCVADVEFWFAAVGSDIAVRFACRFRPTRL